MDTYAGANAHDVYAPIALRTAYRAFANLGETVQRMRNGIKWNGNALVINLDADTWNIAAIDRWFWNQTMGATLERREA